MPRSHDVRGGAPDSNCKGKCFDPTVGLETLKSRKKYFAPAENVIQITWVPNIECHNVALSNSYPWSLVFHRCRLNHREFQVVHRHSGAAFSTKIAVSLCQLLFHHCPIHVYQKEFCIRPHLRLRHRGVQLHLIRQIKINMSTSSGQKNCSFERTKIIGHPYVCQLSTYVFDLANKETVFKWLSTCEDTRGGEGGAS